MAFPALVLCPGAVRPHFPACLLAAGRCQESGGTPTVTNSYYHDSIGVAVPPWNLTTTWGTNGELTRFDNVLMAFWVLFQVSIFRVY